MDILRIFCRYTSFASVLFGSYDESGRGCRNEPILWNLYDPVSIYVLLHEEDLLREEDKIRTVVMFSASSFVSTPSLLLSPVSKTIA